MDPVTLNEATLQTLPETKKPIYIYEWLRRLDAVLFLLSEGSTNESNAKQRTEDMTRVRQCQKDLVRQLVSLIQQQQPGQQQQANQQPQQQTGSPGPPLRLLIARCLTNLFTVGDTFLLFDTINKCNDLLKNKDDSQGFLITRLTSIRVLGTMYEKLGRMTGRSYEETVTVLNKGLKNAESQTRAETMIAFGKVCTGLGTAASTIHRDIYKSARSALTDRAMPVRAAAAECLLALSQYATFMYTSELDNVCQTSFRALDGSNHEARKHISKLLGTLVAFTQKPPDTIVTGRGGMIHTAKKGPAGGQQGGGGAQASLPLNDALSVLIQGYIKGGSSGSGLMISKSGSVVSAEVRVGVSQALIVFAQTLGGKWLERNLRTFMGFILTELLSHPKTTTTHTDAVFARRCVGHVIRALVGRLLSEKAQLSACKDLAAIVSTLMVGVEGSSASTPTSGEPSIATGQDLQNQHVLVVALQELGHLFGRLGTSIARSLLNAGDPTATHTQLVDNNASTNAGIPRLTDTLLSVLLHPCPAPRLAAAWCLRCLCVAVPSHLTPSIDLCLDGLENLRRSPEAIYGYSAALAALLGAVRHTPLGIPHTRGKIVFNVGEELLRSASQNSRLSRERTQAGWLLIGAIMTLGPAVVKGLLPRMMLLWRNAFPRSSKELDSEKARGDAFTWRISLEARAGALSSMHSFLQNSPDLVSEDIIRRLSVPLESALTLLSQAPNILKTYLGELKPLLAMVRLRLFETLSLLPPNCLDGSYAQLLRLLVSEFTLTDGQTGASTSLLTTLCHSDDAIILVGPHLATSSSTKNGGASQSYTLSLDEFNYLEEMLLPNNPAGCGALEHDLTSLYGPLPEGQPDPGSLPLGIAVVDISIVVFGVVFPRVAQKHRLQMLEHFGQHLRQPPVTSQSSSSSSPTLSKPEAININILAAILSALRGLVEGKAKLGQDDIKKAAAMLILGCLTSPNAMVRCSAAECLGRMAQVVSDPQFVAEMAQNSFDSLKSARDVVSRTGHSLSLGCLHRYVGGMGSSQHLHTSVSILLALAQDVASPQVQVWALHALAMIADSGGPMFRGFVEPTLSTVVKLLLSLQTASLEVMVCLGRLLSALITTVGPELQGNSSGIAAARSSFLCACSILQNDPRPVVQAEAISGMQQIHMFAPTSVNLGELVPMLCRLLNSPHFVLRKSSVACLRQFAQREAAKVFWFAATESALSSTGVIHLNKQFGLPGMLFSLLDYEVDPGLISNIHDTINSIMHSMVAENLTSWLHLCREMLSMSSDEGSTTPVNRSTAGKSLKADDDDDAANDDEEFTVGSDVEENLSIQPRWPTRVFAALCLRKIIEDCCQGNRAHYDKSLAQEMHLMQSKGDFLVLHLSELVRVAFMAATSDSDPLRLEGLKTLEVIIEKFGETPEPEFPEHVILEQYQAQVGAALRPAFAPDTPSHVTAAACNVCSAWMGSGVARELSDLRRVYQLLVKSLGKLKPKVVSNNLSNVPRQSQIIYNESALTLEKLSILKAWAEVYVASMKNETSVKTDCATEETKKEPKSVNQDDEDFGDFESTSVTSGNNISLTPPIQVNEASGSLASLVQAELPSLSKYWLAALKDHALLSLPPEFKSQLPFEGGAFYSNDTIESARPHYRATWPPILHATSVWVTYGHGFENVQFESKEDVDVDGSSNLGLGPANAAASKSPEEINTDRFHLIFGVSMEALSNTRSADMSKEQVTSCLLTMRSLLDNSWVRSTIFSKEKVLLIELCNVLHRTVLTRDQPGTQIIAVDVLHLILAASAENLESAQKSKRRELGIPANRDPSDLPTELPLLGEGAEDGNIEPGKSVAFATLEVCLCILVRYYPDLSPRATNLSSVAAIRAKSRSGLGHRTDVGKFGPNEQQAHLIAATVRALSRLPALCSPKGALTVLPSIMWLVTGVLKESTGRGSPVVEALFEGTDSSPQVSAALQSLKTLVTCHHARDERSQTQWTEILQSSLLNILDLAKTSQGDPNELHDVNLLRAVAVFILHGPEGSVIQAPGVKYPAINAFVRTFQQSDDAVVRRSCIQTAASIFEQADHVTALSFVQALAPVIMEFLLVDETSRAIKNESDLLLTLECVRALEILMTSPNLRVIPEGDDEASADAKRVEKLLIFLVPILVSHLLRPEDMKEASQLRMLLHEKSLLRLTTIGQRWPHHFKLILSQHEELKTTLEAAVRANHERLKIREAKQKLAAESEAKSGHQVPSIKLTMDFSKFAAK